MARLAHPERRRACTTSARWTDASSSRWSSSTAARSTTWLRGAHAHVATRSSTSFAQAGARARGGARGRARAPRLQAARTCSSATTAACCVTDFGLARGVDGSRRRRRRRVRRASSRRRATLTRDRRASLGTPAYMAPEQLRRRAPSTRAPISSASASRCGRRCTAARPSPARAGASWRRRPPRGRITEPPSSARVPAPCAPRSARAAARSASAAFRRWARCSRALDPDPARRRARARCDRRRRAGGARRRRRGRGRASRAIRARSPSIASPACGSDARAAVHAAFTATGAPYAEASFGRNGAPARRRDGRVGARCGGELRGDARPQRAIGLDARCARDLPRAQLRRRRRVHRRASPCRHQRGARRGAGRGGGR